MNLMLDDLHKVGQMIKEGAVILCPTDTIWGLSCDALNKDAVSKIYDIKERDRKKPLILIVNSIEMLKQYIVDIHPRIETLIEFYERPMSVIYKAKNLPHYLINNDGTIAIRVTYDDMLIQLIEAANTPIVSTSANKQGTPSPRVFSEIDSTIVNAVDYVFNSRRNEFNSKASLIIKFNNEGELLFLR